MRKFQRFFDQIVSVLIDRGVATQSEIIGCTPAEIVEVETDAGAPLPEAYVEFLRQLGCSAGKFYLGSDIYYPTLLGLTESGSELVGEDESGLTLPDDAIVFAMHQGYEFLFVRSTEGDDPPVYYYMEMSGVYVTKAGTLSGFLMDAAYDDW